MPKNDQASETILTELRGLIDHLVTVHRIDPDVVLATMLTGTGAFIAGRHGGAMAAAAARDIAQRIEGLPRISDEPLAAMAPMGNA